MVIYWKNFVFRLGWCVLGWVIGCWLGWNLFSCFLGNIVRFRYVRCWYWLVVFVWVVGGLVGSCWCSVLLVCVCVGRWVLGGWSFGRFCDGVLVFCLVVLLFGWFVYWKWICGRFFLLVLLLLLVMVVWVGSSWWWIWWIVVGCVYRVIWCDSGRFLVWWWIVFVWKMLVWWWWFFMLVMWLVVLVYG